jgi:hypothetical protein
LRDSGRCQRQCSGTAGSNMNTTHSKLMLALQPNCRFTCWTYVLLLPHNLSTIQVASEVAVN